MISTISKYKALNLINSCPDLLILDVRRFNEYKTSKIDSAINIPIDDLEYDLDEISEYKNKPILVYCKVGNRSSLACTILEEAGFTDLYNLRGGIIDFQEK